MAACLKIIIRIFVWKIFYQVSMSNFVLNILNLTEKTRV